MDCDHEHLKELYAAVQDLSDEARSAFLREACQDDERLREEVESLISAGRDLGEFMDTPAAEHYAPDLASLEPGSVFSAGQIVSERFRIVRFIAHGGMGEVYEAWDLELRRQVALKTIRPELAPDPRTLERFRQEVALALRVSHPNVCRLYDLERHATNNGPPVMFITMELLEGQTLGQLLWRRGRLTTEEALPIALQMAEALQAAHEAGVVHRDFKPANVMLVRQNADPSKSIQGCSIQGSAIQGLAIPGSSIQGPGQPAAPSRVVVTDFGLAKLEMGMHPPATPGSAVTKSNAQMVGTVAYMAPEQLEGGEVTSATDIYALGLVLYELVTGHRPFENESLLGEAAKRLKGPPPSPASRVPGLDPRWTSVILRCLEATPAARFESANEVSEALVNVCPPPPRRREGAALLVSLVFALAILAGVGWYFFHRTPAPISSVAVLPFQIATKDAGLDYLGDGIARSLTSDLSRVSGLRVTAESVAFHYNGSGQDPRSAGRDMGVQAIVAGSISKDGASLHIPIEIVDVKTGSQLWGQVYDRKPGELARFQEDIAKEVAYHLQSVIDDNLKDRLSRQYSTDPSTYDLYLKGRFYLNKRTTDGFRQANTYFQRAIGNNPNYAPAYAGLADTYTFIASGGLEPAATLLREAKDAANRALELDSTLGEAYVSLAYAKTLADFDWDGAEQDYKRAIELNPGYLIAHTWYAVTLLTPQGRHEEARAQINAALQLDPQSMVPRMSAATSEYCGGDYDRSVQRLDGLRRDFPFMESFNVLLAMNYLAKGAAPQALTMMQSSAPASPEDENSRTVTLALIYAHMGQKEEALRRLEHALSAEQSTFTISYQLAAVYAALGMQTKALDVLRRMYADRNSDVLYIGVEPMLAQLRPDPRFQELLKQMNLH